MEKSKLDIWIKDSSNRSFEDLYFILLESKNNKSSDKEVLNELKNILLFSLDRADYNYLIESKKIEILDCLDLLFDIYGKHLLKDRQIYSIEKNGGINFLKKHGFNLNKKSYLTHKLQEYFYQKVLEYKSAVAPNKDWLDGFLVGLKKQHEGADTSFIQNQINCSILFFCASIELGFQPSKKDILNLFIHIWENITYKKRNELNFFCEFFAKTNVFQNSIAPAKNIEQLLKKFFNGLLMDCDEQIKFKITYYDKIFPHEEKLYMFLNNPAFMHENIKNLFLRKNAQKYFGKNFLNKEEKVLVLLKANENKNVSKKIKI